ncbi:MAG: tetratricopeptide repeat protein [Thiotrichales bacterium]|nr:tetratricopeptide repeat protein [Thiotrichales bacterium]
MTVTARKYNPGFLSDDELVASFCVRTDELESMLEVLRECSGSSNTHQIVIGPRGSGKTSLLLRISVEIHRDAGLSSRLFPIVFSEESYEVSSAGEFWLECLYRLADQAPPSDNGPDLSRTLEDLRQIRDDRELGDRCLGALQDFSDRAGRRLVLIVENLNMMLRDIADREVGWRLRQTLQTEPRILLLASATSRFREIDNPKCALYELFREVTLRPLDPSECAALWQSVSGRARPPETIQALRILTGGSPRLLTIVARFGARLSFRELMADLLDLVDDHTEYFKSHLDALPAQERRVYLALANLWIPATAREIADRARLDTSKCSAQLARLVERGAVEVTGGSARRKLYYLAERLYNIYYLMRRSRGPVPLIDALIRFMEGYYSADELRELGVRIAHEATGLDHDAQSVYRTAFSRLLKLRSLKAHREELRSLAPWNLGDRPGDYPYIPSANSGAKALFDKAYAMAANGRLPEALSAWNEVVRRLEASNAAVDLEAMARALVNRGNTLAVLGRPDEALATWDEVVRRFGSEDRQIHYGAAARALLSKVAMLGELGRPGEALVACDDLLDRLGAINPQMALVEVAIAMVLRGHMLGDLDRPEDALTAWDEVVQRFGSGDEPAVLEQVASALLNKGAVLARLNRIEESLAACIDVVQRFGSSDSPSMAGPVAMALANSGSALLLMNRPKEALPVWDEVMRRCEAGECPGHHPMVATSLIQKGATLLRLNRPDDALKAWDEVVRHSGTSDEPEALQTVGTALANKGGLLASLGRAVEALVVCDEIVERFGEIDAPGFALVVAEALVNKGALLIRLNRQREGFAAWDEIVQRFGSSEEAMVREAAAIALFHKGNTLARMNRHDEGIAVCDELVRRFGSGDTPTTQATVATALVKKGGTLAELNRLEDALDAFEEVVRRFESSNLPELQVAFATALLGKSAVLARLGRLAQALSICDEVLQRHRTETATASLEMVASALVAKGALLAGSKRLEEALAVWEEVVQRFGKSDLPMLRNEAEMALVRKAEIELECDRAEAAIELVSPVLEREIAGLAETRWQGHMIRAKANLADHNIEACVRDVEAVLAILPELGPLPKAALDGLSSLAVELDPQKIRDLIKASPASDLLLPMTTALEKELGLEPRVAKEVAEVAEDIRRDWEERRKVRKS